MNNSENVSVLSESEVLVMFVTPDGEDIARNISEYYKIIQRWRIGKESKERNIKIRPSIYLKENFMQKYIYIFCLFVFVVYINTLLRVCIPKCRLHCCPNQNKIH